MISHALLKDIERWSFKYYITKFYVDLAHSMVFYNNHIINGLENIPEGEPVIFAANHQNALMDALAILASKDWQPVFLARADIFNKPFLAKLLMSFKILPVYRPRDSGDIVKLNEEIFKTSVEILKSKRILVIFPEASHLGKHFLRPLHKGLTRIAFQAQTEIDVPVNIIPIGINYSDYFKYRSSVMVNFGKPIKVSDYMDEYKQSPQRAAHHLLVKLAEDIRPLIIDIKDDEYYETFEKLRKVYDYKMVKKLGLKNFNLPNKIEADKKLIQKLYEFKAQKPEEMKELKDKTEWYFVLKAQNNLNDWIFDREFGLSEVVIHFVVLLILFPIFFFGAINNILPFKIPSMITKNVKDRNFHSSFHFVVGLVIFPIFYAILFFIVMALEPVTWLKYLYLGLLPVTGIIAYHYYVTLDKAIMKLRFFVNRKTDKIKKLKELRNEIIAKLDAITN